MNTTMGASLEEALGGKVYIVERAILESKLGIINDSQSFSSFYNHFIDYFEKREDPALLFEFTKKAVEYGQKTELEKLLKVIELAYYNYLSNSDFSLRNDNSLNTALFYLKSQGMLYRKLGEITKEPSYFVLSSIFAKETYQLLSQRKRGTRKIEDLLFFSFVETFDVLISSDKEAYKDLLFYFKENIEDIFYSLPHPTLSQKILFSKFLKKFFAVEKSEDVLAKSFFINREIAEELVERGNLEEAANTFYYAALDAEKIYKMGKDKLWLNRLIYVLKKEFSLTKKEDKLLKSAEFLFSAYLDLYKIGEFEDTVGALGIVSFLNRKGHSKYLGDVFKKAISFMTLEDILFSVALFEDLKENYPWKGFLYYQAYLKSKENEDSESTLLSYLDNAINYYELSLEQFDKIGKISTASFLSSLYCEKARILEGEEKREALKEALQYSNITLRMLDRVRKRERIKRGLIEIEKRTLKNIRSILEDYSEFAEIPDYKEIIWLISRGNSMQVYRKVRDLLKS